jgi:hypothetical protein
MPLVFAASPINTQLKGARVKTSWVGIIIICRSKESYLPAECTFSEIEILISNYGCWSIVQSGYHLIKCNLFSTWYRWKMDPLVLNNNHQGRIQGGWAPPPKIGKNKIFWRKIVIFHTKYSKNVRASLRSAQFFLTWNAGSAPDHSLPVHVIFKYKFPKTQDKGVCF